MKKIIASSLAKINLAIALTLLFAVGSVNGQDIPDGLIGINDANSDTEPAVLFSIDPSTGAATPIVTLDSGASHAGLTFLQGTLFSSDLCGIPGCNVFFIGSISTNGVTTFLSNQNGSSNWQGLASDEAGGVMYSIDLDNNDILTAQFPDGSVQTIGSGTGIDGRGMAYDDANDILYAISDGSLYTVSTTNGTSNLIGNTGVAVSGGEGLAYDECNRILYLNDGELRQLYIVDVNNGSATLVGPNGVDTIIDGLAWKGTCPIQVSQIPTLSEWGMISAVAGLSLIGVFFAVKRRKVQAGV